MAKESAAIEGAAIGTGKKEVGVIGFCMICRNKAELHKVLGDSRDMCGDCAEAITYGMKRRKVGPYSEEIVGAKAKVVPTQAVSPNGEQPTDEKSNYLKIIRDGVSPDMIDTIIQEILVKKILHFDFNRIIENDRWFSVLDLRRMALQVDPDFEKPKPIPPEPEKEYRGPVTVLKPHKEPKKVRRSRT